MRLNEIINEDLRAWFGKGKKAALAAAAGMHTTVVANVLANVATQMVVQNPSA